MSTLVGVTGLTLMLLCLLQNRNARLKRRLQDLAEETGGEGGESDTAEGLTACASRFGAYFLPADPVQRHRLQIRLIQAGIDRSLAPFLFVTARVMLPAAGALASLAAGCSGLVAAERAFMAGILLAGIGTILPGLWLDHRKARRTIAISRSLPDFLDLLVTCLESGLSLDAALRRVTAELRVAHPLLAVEMDRVQSETGLGATADAALIHLGERCDVEAITALGMFVQQARRFGVSIADALRVHAETLRDQRELRAEDLAQKAAVKILFPTLLLIFPAVFVVLAGPAAIKLNEKFATPSPTSARTPSDQSPR